MTNSEISNLVSELTEEKLSTLVYEIIKQDKLCIPLFYNTDHSKEFGFDNLKQMNNVVYYKSALQDIAITYIKMNM